MDIKNVKCEVKLDGWVKTATEEISNALEKAIKQGLSHSQARYIMEKAVSTMAIDAVNVEVDYENVDLTYEDKSRL